MFIEMKYVYKADDYNKMSGQFMVATLRSKTIFTEVCLIFSEYMARQN